jgi:hypothetical protein
VCGRTASIPLLLPLKKAARSLVAGARPGTPEVWRERCDRSLCSARSTVAAGLQRTVHGCSATACPSGVRGELIAPTNPRNQCVASTIRPKERMVIAALGNHAMMENNWGFFAFCSSES